MPLFHLAILAVIQGLTEFLPISSSGHLALYPLLSGAQDQGLALDVAVHVGTLLAVILYFRQDVWSASRGGFRLLRGDIANPEAFLMLLLIVATIPAVLAGGLLFLFDLTDMLRSLEVIAWATLIGGVVLYIADKWGPQRKAAKGWLLKDALAMGVAQAFALIPGASRSGVTMTAARALGYERVDAAHLSMLMSIPTIIAAGALLSIKLVSDGDAQIGGDAGLAAGLAFVAAFAAIHFMMRMFRTWSMAPFAAYRLILGGALLWLVYG